jgi:multiple sugar transport system ATP-binding protein
MAEVRLENVGKTYDSKVRAVKDVSFTVFDKEFVVLVGPSGCGKSTILRMIAGLEAITSGTISIGGKPVNDLAPKDRDIAMVFQNYALYPHMTVFENMAFGLKLRKIPKQKIEKEVLKAAKILDLNGLLNRKPKALSGGQQQRVAVGRALVRNPRVFLFDEPLSNLDAKLRIQMRSEITRLHQRLEATMIYVTHDQVEAMTMGDRIVVLNQGEVQQIDTPLNLYFHPQNRFTAGFIGSPPMNFLTGKIEKGNFHGQGLNFPLKSSISIEAPGEVHLGIRPEDIHVEKNDSLIKIDAVADVIEPMGHEVHLYIKAGQADLVARVPSVINFRAGEPIPVYLDTRKIFLFNSESGLSI